MTDPAPRPRRVGPLITAGVIFCLLTALAYAAWRTCTGPGSRGSAVSAQEAAEKVGRFEFPASGRAAEAHPGPVLLPPS